MNKRFYILSLAIALIASCSLFATCKKDECIANSYSFKENWQIAGGMDSIPVGDTIVFNSNFSTMPFDVNSGHTVSYGRAAEINMTLGVYSLRPGLQNATAAVDSFKFLPLQGRVETNPNTAADHIKQLYYQEANGKYIIKFQMIPLKRGIYCFGVSNAISRRNNLKGCDDHASFYLTNNNLNNHIYYLQQFYGTQNLPEGETEHGYCLKVK